MDKAPLSYVRNGDERTDVEHCAAQRHAPPGRARHRYDREVPKGVEEEGGEGDEEEAPQRAPPALHVLSHRGPIALSI